MDEDPHALLARLVRRIAPEVDLTTIDPGESLREAADLDSMDFLNLLTALANETGIEVPEHDYRQVDSIDGFAAYVRRAGSAV